MIYALNKDKIRVLASKDGLGICPVCKDTVVAKCGLINRHHWAHKTKDCELWHEPETQWHIGWKSRFPSECVEVGMGEHRADVRVGKITVEFQNSSISPSDILAREDFYRSRGAFVWVFNGESFLKNFEFKRELKPDYYTFRWKRPRRSYWNCKSSIYIDFGEDYSDLIHIRKLYPNIPCGGWGHSVDKDKFVSGILRAVESRQKNPVL